MVVVACFLGALGFILLGDARALPVQTVTVLLLWGFAAQLMAKPKASLPWLILVAVGLRALICFSNPTLSDDVYRYLWEGKSLWEGVNPYVVSVSESSHLDGIGQQVNHPQVTSVYPPIAMYVFALAAKLLYQPLIMQLIASVADVCIVVLLHRILTKRKQPTHNAWLYALHPLAVVESASSGHIESIALVFLLLAISSGPHTTVRKWFLFIGGGIKLLPFVLLPLTQKWRSTDVVGMLIVLLLILYPFADVNSLNGLLTYTKHWSFNGSIYAVMEFFIGSYARWVCLGFGLGVCCVVWRWQFSLERGALWVCGAFVLLSPTVHPWYGLWVWVPALLCRIPAWNLLATMLPLSYVALATIDPETGAWSPQIWPSIVIYSSFFLCLSWEFVKQIRYPGPWGSGRPLIK